MSGLCGYVGANASMALADMAHPLSRFDAAPLRTAGKGLAGLALAAQAGSVHVHEAGDLMVAIWGRPTILGRTADIAATFYRIWLDCGPAACAQLSGPFALCALDTRGGEALLAVDRAGIHPLAYQYTGEMLLFGSNADAILAHPMSDSSLDAQSLYHYLHFHVIPAPRSVYGKQQRLFPGEYLHLARGKIRRGRYWKLQFDESDGLSYDTLRSQFLGILGDAVRATLDTPQLGAFLSGGTDSSTLAGFLGQASCAPARTFSIGFDVPGYDEMAYARLAARHFGAEHRELYVSPAHVVAGVQRLARAFDQPFGNASALPAYFCAHLAKQDGVTRLLAGDGGDELFGGNERYAQQAIFSRYEKVPSAIRQMLLEPVFFGLAANRQQALFCKARSYISQALLTMPARLDSYNLLNFHGPEQVFEPDFLGAVDRSAPGMHQHQLYWEGDTVSQINRMQALDLQLTLADNDLRKVGSACELAGVEVAYPFLSDAMLSFSAALAPRYKLQGTHLRPFFKRALSARLPRAILRKKKHGFGLPFGNWLHSDPGLYALAGDSLQSLKRRGIVQSRFIDRLLNEHLAQHPAYHGTMVWILMMLELWFQARKR